jgi:membrane protein implicated in regulation of membrane protease activity
MSNQSDSLAPLVIAFVLVYALALLICGVLVNGTIVLAFVTVGVMAVVAALMGVEVFRKLDDGD